MSADITLLEDDFETRLARLIADAPGKITITSGKRSTAEQAALYAKKPNLAAPPGKSKHEHGLAADLAYASPEVQAWAHANAHRYGLRFPMLTKAPGKKYEPWHIEPIGSAARAQAAGAQAQSGATTETEEKPNEYEEDRHDIGVQLSTFLGILERPLDDITAPPEGLAA